VSRRLGEHEAACQRALTAGPEEKAAPGASVKTLSSLTLSALSVEMECGELTERLMCSLRLAQWRERALQALHAPSSLTGAAPGSPPPS
jgi:hypothetical protein